MVGGDSDADGRQIRWWWQDASTEVVDAERGGRGAALDGVGVTVPVEAQLVSA
jgi:hypothetical protein